MRKFCAGVAFEAVTTRPGAVTADGMEPQARGRGRGAYPRPPVDRDEIEHPRFPTARRGLDEAAVHAHLQRVADEFDVLAARTRPASLAEGASSQVREILEAAESSAQALREGAGREGRSHVERVGEAARQLLARLDHLQRELDRLLGGLRSSAESLAGSLGELGQDAGALAPVHVSAATPPSESAAAPPPDSAAAPPPEREPTPPPVPAPDSNGGRSEDESGARLVALNMALEGAPRRQTAGYLAEHFALPDVDALLDAVYVSAGR